MNTTEIPVLIPPYVQSISLKEFFLAWPVSRAVIAEKLRQAGLNVTAKEIKAALQKGEEDFSEFERTFLSLAVMTIKGDISKIKDLKNKKTNVRGENKSL